MWMGLNRCYSYYRENQIYIAIQGALNDGLWLTILIHTTACFERVAHYTNGFIMVYIIHSFGLWIENVLHRSRYYHYFIHSFPTQYEYILYIYIYNSMAYWQQHTIAWSVIALHIDANRGCCALFWLNAHFRHFVCSQARHPVPNGITMLSFTIHCFRTGPQMGNRRPQGLVNLVMVWIMWTHNKKLIHNRVVCYHYITQGRATLKTIICRSRTETGSSSIWVPDTFGVKCSGKIFLL